MSHIVAIVGRPNVGKSTLFNRLVKQRQAIVHEESGVTRDRHYGKCHWNGYEFSVIDTGGYVNNSDDIFEEEIRKQVMLAVQEADAVLFMVDVTAGITDLDASVAKILRKIEKKIYIVVNKVDNTERYYDAHEFYKLGLGDLHCISSINGSGTGDLLDAITDNFLEKGEEITEEIPRLAIVGRPNVGKSSLLNTLLEEDRNIVTPIAGTTRDTIDIRFQKFGYDFYLLDTAGIRKKNKVHENVEFYSVMRSIRAIETADLCFLMLDATRGVEAQDVNILHIIQRNKKGVVVLVNKWDLIEKDTNTANQFIDTIKERFAPFSDFPVIFTSAIYKKRILKTLETARQVYENRKQKISTSKLNEVMQKAIQDYNPPAVKGRFIKIKYITQLSSQSPAFAFFCNFPQYIKPPYRRYLENRLRENFNFKGVPIQIYFRKK